LTLSLLLFFTNCVVAITEYLISNNFQYQRIGKLKKTLKLNGPQTRLLKKRKCGSVTLTDA